METVSFKIGGLSSREGPAVEKRSKRLTGLDSFRLNLIMNPRKVFYNPSAVSIEEIEKAAARAGARTRWA